MCDFLRNWCPLPPQHEWTLRRVVAELPFIPATSNWLKLLLALLAEPLMFLSSLSIIAETVLPGATTWPSLLINGPKTVMSLAPEIILPGCFQQAQFVRRKPVREAWERLHLATE